MSRADKFTIQSERIELYSDFLINFDRNPVTGLLAKATDEEAIKASMRNLILTMLTERYYQPYTGSKTQAILFELNDSTAEESLKTSIEYCLRNHEKRAKILNIDVQSFPSKDGYLASIDFECQNIQGGPFNLPLFIKRVR
jgi:phage baseplate assembly protein W